MTKPTSLVAELAKVQYDLTALKMRVSEIQRQVAELNVAAPDTHRCSCGLTFKSAGRLAEHRYLTHDDAEPEHWSEAERLAETEAA